MSSKTLDSIFGTQPPRIRILPAILIALVLVVGAISLVTCRGPESIQMIPSPAPSATQAPRAAAAATGTSSAQIVATQSVRVTVRRTSGYNQGMTPPGAPPVVRTTKQESPGGLFLPDDQGEEIVIEVSQAIAAAATSSAQASASAEHIGDVTEKVTDSRPLDHGRLGVIAATMPGILAADVEIYRIDVSPVTRWLVDADIEAGLDVAGNLEAGAVGATVGSKAFAGVYYWSRWNLSAQGPAVVLGLRF